MREEGTEPPGSSELNSEKRTGTYHCAGCDTLLFDSEKNMKAGVDGHLSLKVNQRYLKLKLIIT